MQAYRRLLLVLSRSLGAGLAAALVSVLIAPAADACTTFCMQSGSGPVFGKNYDWNVDDGLVVVNKRGVTRGTAASGLSPGQWQSRYGSVTFNQYGRDQPSGGINEKGLTIELMWLQETRYPEPDERLQVGCLGWIQYQLDRHATVAEVIASDALVRISGAPIHYLVADPSGALAAIEFLDGKMVVHTGDALSLPALANSTYSESKQFAARTRQAKGLGSLERFTRAGRHASKFRGDDDPVEHAFSILADVEAPHTQWSIVYELGPRRVHYRTRPAREQKTLSLSDLDFACTAPVQVVDINTPKLAGNVRPHLVDYATDLNLALIRTSFAETSFLSEVPDATLRELAAQPAATVCAVTGDW